MVPYGAGARSQTGTATIAGTVVARSSDEPIADATVTLYASTFPDGRITTTTDSRGRFQFAQLPAGRYTVGAGQTAFVNTMSDALAETDNQVNGGWTCDSS